MTTSLEILDSAVKIGLGALISGVSTYVVTRRSHLHEMRKLASEDARALLRQSCTLVEEAAAQVNMFIHANDHRVAGAVPDSALLLSALAIVNKAKALAVLVNNARLLAAVLAYANTIESLYYWAEGDSTTLHANEAQRLVAELNLIQERLNSAFGEAYNARTGDA
jgi:hypothetical protein